MHQNSKAELPFSSVDDHIQDFVRDQEAIDFSRYGAILRRLRAPDGCPWDQKQTLASLRRFIIEESFELTAAIDKGDYNHIAEELGDVLLVFYLLSDALEKEGNVTLSTVIRDNGDKLIRRHPHVFGAIAADTSDQVVANWEKIKKEQEGRSDSPINAGVGLPPLERSYEVQKKASKLGFDWKDVTPAIAKVREELSELEQEIERAGALHDPDCAKDDLRIEQEIGDLLFSVVNVSRHLKTDPSLALGTTISTFLKRFSFIEQTLSAKGQSFDEMSLKELDQLWDEAKQLGNER